MNSNQTADVLFLPNASVSVIEIVSWTFQSSNWYSSKVIYAKIWTFKNQNKKSYIQIEELKIPIDLYTEKFEEKKIYVLLNLSQLVCKDNFHWFVRQ